MRDLHTERIVSMDIKTAVQIVGAPARPANGCSRNAEYRADTRAARDGQQDEKAGTL